MAYEEDPHYAINYVGEIRIQYERYARETAKVFLDSTAIKKFAIMSEMVQKCAELWTRDFERIKIGLDRIYLIQRKDVDARELLKTVRTNTVEVKESLRMYYQLHFALDHNLKVISSPETIYQELAQKGVSRAFIESVTPMVNEEFRISYGPLIKKFELLRSDTEELGRLLQLQHDLLEKLPHDDYFLGVQDDVELWKLFQQEYNTFWNRFLPHSLITDEDYDLVEQRFKMWVRKVGVSARTYGAVYAESFGKNVAQAEGDLMKTMIVTLYVGGILLLIRDCVKKGTSRFVGIGLKKVVDFVRNKFRNQDNTKGRPDLVIQKLITVIEDYPKSLASDATALENIASLVGA